MSLWKSLTIYFLVWTTIIGGSLLANFYHHREMAQDNALYESIPIQSFLAQKNDHVVILQSSHALVWFLGLGLITFFTKRRFLDLSAINQSLEALQSSHALLERAQEITHVGNWVRDLESGTLIWSQELYRILGLDHRQFHASFDNFLNCIHPDDRRTVLEAVKRSIESLDDTFQVEYRIIRPDGEERIVRAIGHVERNDDGTPRQTIGTVQDITQARRASQTIQDQQILFRSIFDKALDAIISMDREGNVVDFNPSAEAIFGYSRQEILGKQLVDYIIPDELKERHNTALAKRLASGGAPTALGKRFELPGLRSDGTRIDLEMALTMIKTNADVFYTGFIHDVTEKKQLFQSLRDTLQTAEAANQAKSDFLATMSHEIRSPMNAILGMTDLVLNTDLTESQRDHLNIVQSSASNLLEIINNILDFSKIEAGKVTLEQIPFDLRDQIEEICETLAIRAHQKGLELLCDIPPDLPEMVGDPHRLHQILMNLVDNAIKFTSQGDVVVRVTCGPSAMGDGKTSEIHIGVEDTGIGIATQHIEQLFEQFTQADGSTTRKYGGTGLGLTISKRLVALMDGKIWVDSTPDQGSTFHVLLHFPINQECHSAPKSSRHLSGVRLLLGIGNDKGRTILKRTLTHFGAQITEAKESSSLLESLKSSRQVGQPFQIIILDTEMPESASFWQEVGTDEKILILTSTNPNQGNPITNAIFSKAARLRKPIKLNSLFKKMDLLLDRNRVDNQKPAPNILEGAGHAVKKKAPVLLPVAVDLATFETNRRDFLDNGPDHHQQLHWALQAHEVRQTLAELQWIQEAAAKLGANRLKILSTRLKGVTELKDWEETAKRFKDLDQEFQNVLAALLRKRDLS
ncbi:MAG: PAS domain S-box protein [Nitrospirae bacterium]|nr:PAS domain S-box protein [Magnetococcales bacterium]